MDQMKSIKHQTKKNKDDEVQVEGWPPGKVLWDRYTKAKSEIKNKINVMLPASILTTPSGTGLRKAFENAAFKLYIKYYNGKNKMEAESDPHKHETQEEINKLLTKPFCYLFTAKVFYNHAVLCVQHGEQQRLNQPASKADLLKAKKERMKARAKERTEAIHDLETAEVRKKQKVIAMNAQSRMVKANSLQKVANGQNMKTYSDIAKEIYSPETYRKKMMETLQNFERDVQNGHNEQYFRQ